MDTREINFICNYVDASRSNASQMLNKCTQEPSLNPGLLCPAKSYQARRNTTYTDMSAINRGYATSGQFTSGQFTSDQFTSSQSDGSDKYTSSNYEGFKTDNGPGKSTIPDRCPEGFSYDPEQEACFQVCQGCVYRDNMKSREFNEADPCFPQGVYNGLNADGSIRCTCGSQNQYCKDIPSDGYTTNGGLFMLF